MIRATIEAGEIAQVAAGILFLMLTLIVLAEGLFSRRQRRRTSGPIQRPERYQREAERRVR